jgi:hypothetical protein
VWISIGRSRIEMVAKPNRILVIRTNNPIDRIQLKYDLWRFSEGQNMHKISANPLPPEQGPSSRPFRSEEVINQTLNENCGSDRGFDGYLSSKARLIPENANDKNHCQLWLNLKSEISPPAKMDDSEESPIE